MSDLTLYYAIPKINKVFTNNIGEWLLNVWAYVVTLDFIWENSSYILFTDIGSIFGTSFETKIRSLSPIKLSRTLLSEVNMPFRMESRADNTTVQNDKYMTEIIVKSSLTYLFTKRTRSKFVRWRLINM